MAWRNLRAELAEEFGGYSAHELDTEFARSLWANRLERERQRARDRHELNRFRRKVDLAYLEKCRAEWRENNKKRYWRRRTECLARSRDWQKANPERVRARQRAWDRAHREEIRARYAARKDELNAHRRAKAAAKPKPPRLSTCGHPAPNRTGTPARFCSEACRGQTEAAGRHAYYLAHKEEYLARQRAYRAAKAAPRPRLVLVPDLIERESALYALLEEIHR